MPILQLATGLDERPWKSVKNVLHFRRKLLEDCYGHTEQARMMRAAWYQACASSVVFFCNTCVWLYEPRPNVARIGLNTRKAFMLVPFVLYPFQEDAIRHTERAVDEGRDLLIAKSRDMGATWMAMAFIAHRLIFRRNESILVASRNADLVDKPGDLNALMPKIDHIIAHLPHFMKPPIKAREDRKEMFLRNPETGSVVVGATTTGDIGRGGRMTMAFMDEFAAMENQAAVMSAINHATSCAIFASTFRGDNDVFARKYLEQSMDILALHWSHHPLKSRGLYTTQDNNPLVLDKKHPPEDCYEFVLDGKIRSPWYDWACSRAASQVEIARELDMDPKSSAANFFDASTIRRIEAEDVRHPYRRGVLDFDTATANPVRWVDDTQGNISIWMNLIGADVPPKLDCVAAADVSSGTGASNSVLSVATRDGEKIAEIVDSRLMPHQFAALSVAFCRWIGDAFLTWESNGPGRQFGQTVIDLGYTNFQVRPGDSPLAERAGWASTLKSKTDLLNEYQRMLRMGTFINRSAPAVRELEQYMFDSAGRPVHVSSKYVDDFSGAGAAHGDRVIADALCASLVRGSDRPDMADIPPEPVYGSYEWRLRQRENSLARKRNW